MARTILRIIGAVLICIGLIAFLPAVYIAAGSYCLIHLTPPYGEASVESSQAPMLIRILFQLGQLVLIGGGAGLLVLGFRRRNEE